MNTPQIIVQYNDSDENFQGWLVIDENRYDLSAGGIRVQKGLSAEKLSKMALNMTRKMAVWELPINGAKCGINYDPYSPNKKEALRRFIKAIKPFLACNYSMGADLNTKMSELDDIANQLGLSSVKNAIKNNQKLSDIQFNKKIEILNQTIYKKFTVGHVRAGWGVGSAVVELAKITDSTLVTVQGFGTLSKGALFRLKDEKIVVKAISDVEKCIIDTTGNGINIEELLDIDDTLLPSELPGTKVVDRDELLITQSDILILAAIENAISTKIVPSLDLKCIVQGANLAVVPEANELLHERGIIVTPSFVSGSAGTLFMKVLFGNNEKNDPKKLLLLADIIMRKKINSLVEIASKEQCTLEQVAENMVTNTLSRTITGLPYSLPKISEE